LILLTDFMDLAGFRPSVMVSRNWKEFRWAEPILRVWCYKQGSKGYTFK